MKIFKKFVLLLLAVTVLVTGVPTYYGNVATVKAETLTTEEGFEYTVTNGEATIEGYTGTATELVIPEEIDGAKVTSIGYFAFSGCSALKTVTLNEGLESIGDWAFYYCGALTKITIPASVTAIGNHAFNLCDTLKTVTLNEGLESIGDRAFAGCALAEIKIPASVTSIGDSVFSECVALTEIKIPASVTSIGTSAFSGCSGLTSISVDEANEMYYSSGNCLLTKEDNVLILGCSTSVIPNTCTAISNSAFSNCTALTAITIPASVTSIGSYAFAYCDTLTTVKLNEGLTSIGDGAFNDCDVLTEITIPGSVTSIGSSAFYFCGALTEITIPASVTNIGNLAFRGCSGLTGIAVDESNEVYYSSGNCLIRRADNALILGCNTSVIPNTCTAIDDYVFFDCDALEEITIPASVTSIGFSAFYSCSSLTSIIVDEANAVYYSSGNCLLTKADNVLVLGCSTSVIPDTCTAIGSSAFTGCKGLTEIKIPASVTEIEPGAFRGSSELTSISVDEENAVYYSSENCLLTKADNVLVLGCNTSVIPDVCTAIEKYAFYKCALTEITIPACVKSIGELAFEYCEELRFVTLPAALAKIDFAAFSKCVNLSHVLFKGTEAQWKAIIVYDANYALNTAVTHFEASDYIVEELDADYVTEGTKIIKCPHCDFTCLAGGSYTATGKYSVTGENLIALSAPDSEAGILENVTFTAGDVIGILEIVEVNGTVFGKVQCEDGSFGYVEFNVSDFEFTGEELLLGDSNGDGKINMADVVAVRRYLVNAEKYPLTSIENADVNGDGKVNMADVVAVRRYLVNAEKYPIG